MNYMKSIYKIGIFITGLFLCTACHDITTADISKVTYYVTFELDGGDQYLLPVGTSYVEPGVKALENGVDVTSKMIVTGTEDVNSNKIGLYTITYSAKNVDGFSNSTTRTVFVYDPTVTADISGDYSVDATTSQRVQASNGKIIKYSDMQALYGAGDFSTYVVKLQKVVPGIFSVTDFFGGYYTEGRAYASAYAMTGYLSLTPSNKLELCSSYVAGWGTSLDDLTDGVYTPATGNVKWNASWSGYSFNVVLNKK